MAAKPSPAQLAALAAFLGEAPSQAAVRRPATGASDANRGHRGRGDDSSPDTPDRPPTYDGGFDDGYDDRRAPVPEAQPLTSTTNVLNLESKDKGKSRSQRTLPPRAPHDAAVDQGYPAGSGPNGQRRQARPAASASESDLLGKTFTPAPGGFAGMMTGGEAYDDIDARRGPGKRPSLSGGSSGSSAAEASSRGPRSNSRQPRAERSETPTRGGGGGATPGSSAAGSPPPRGGSGGGSVGKSPAVAGVLDMDPLGSTSRRRFGGRG